MKIGGRGWLLIATSAVVLFAIAVGFYVLGSPQEERKRELDRKRIEDLQSIVTDLEIYVNSRGGRPLPASLDSVRSLSGSGGGRHDPSTGALYEYRRIDDTHYELCATFEAGLGEADMENWERKWAHPAGHACYSFDVMTDGRVLPQRGP